MSPTAPYSARFKESQRPPRARTAARPIVCLTLITNCSNSTTIPYPTAFRKKPQIPLVVHIAHGGKPLPVYYQRAAVVTSKRMWKIRPRAVLRGDLHPRKVGETYVCGVGHNTGIRISML